MTSATWVSMVTGVCLSTTLVSILMAAWLTGKSPVLMIGLRTLTTISGGRTPDMVAAQASAALTTCRDKYQLSGDCLTFTSLSVLVSITDDLTNPSRLFSEGSVLADISESLYSWIFSFQFFHNTWEFFFRNSWWSNVRSTACIQDYLVDIGP